MNPFFHCTDNIVVCDLCFRHCNILPGETGFCGVQKNINNTLITTVANHPSAINIDPVEKKPLYHFLPGTEILSVGTIGCNLRCPFCQNSSLVRETRVPSQTVTAQDLVNLAIERNTPAIAFTYNEPTVFWPWAREIAALAHTQNIKTVAVTNGEMSRQVAEDMTTLIDAVNIDIKCASQERYRSTLKGKLNRVLSNIEFLFSNNVWVELTTLIVPDVSNSPEEFSELAETVKDLIGNAVPWHITAFYPAAEFSDRKPTRIDEIETFESILNKLGFLYVYSGNINREDPTLCPRCKKKLIIRNRYTIISNYLQNGRCLHCGREIEGVFK